MTPVSLPQPMADPDHDGTVPTNVPTRTFINVLLTNTFHSH